MNEISGTWSSGRLVELDEAECWELLGSLPVGRLVWNGADGPTAFPVNFTIGDGAVHLRTSGYSAMARECDGHAVAFQADDVDSFHRSGWSVLLRGTAAIDWVHTGDPASEPEPWPTGAKPVHVIVPAVSITGRRLLPS